MRWRDPILALAALGLALLFPFLQRGRAAGSQGKGDLPEARAVIPLSGEVEVGGRRVDTLLYRVDEAPEAHLRGLLERWQGKPVHLHAEAIADGFFLGVVDVHAGLHWVHTIRRRGAGGSEVVRGILRLLPSEEDQHGSEGIELPEEWQRIGHIRDRVGGQEIETLLFFSPTGGERQMERLKGDLALAPCDDGEMAGRGKEIAMSFPSDGARALCGRHRDAEMRILVDPRGETETWMMLRLKRPLQ